MAITEKKNTSLNKQWCGYITPLRYINWTLLLAILKCNTKIRYSNHCMDSRNNIHNASTLKLAICEEHTLGNTCIDAAFIQSVKRFRTSEPV